MLKFWLRRLLATLAVLPVSLLVIFVLLRLTGNPIETALGATISEEELTRRIELAGLDKPVLVQFFDYLRNLFQLNFGVSFKGEDVRDQIFSHLTASAELTLLGLVFLGLFVYFAGITAASHRGRFLDRAISGIAVVTYALPGFLIAVLISQSARVFFPAFELTGRLSLDGQIQWAATSRLTGFVLIDSLLTGNLNLFIDGLSHLVLPALSLVAISGLLIRVFRDSLIREMRSQEVLSAISRGVPASRALRVHSAYGSLPTVLAAFGVTAGALITGVVFVERVFEVRGLGFLLVEAVLQRDFMLVQGIFVVTFLIVTVINNLVDSAIMLIDKRQRRNLS